MVPTRVLNAGLNCQQKNGKNWMNLENLKNHLMVIFGRKSCLSIHSPPAIDRYKFSVIL